MKSAQTIKKFLTDYPNAIVVKRQGDNLIVDVEETVENLAERVVEMLPRLQKKYLGTTFEYPEECAPVIMKLVEGLGYELHEWAWRHYNLEDFDDEFDI